MAEKNTSVPARLAALRSMMKEKGITAYLIPTDDFHGSEYVGEYFKCRHFISGFTGSAGTVVVTADAAGLWTDGRYFIQAAQELSGSGITLYKEGEPGVPKIEAFLAEEMPEGSVLGFDGRTIAYTKAERLREALLAKKITFFCEEDLAGLIWEDRPSLSEKPAWLLALSYAGKTREEKLKEIRCKMKEEKVDAFILAALDDIAWLLNFRGSDAACNPVMLCYAIITANKVILFVDKAKFSEEAQKELIAAGVLFYPYDDIYSFIRTGGLKNEIKEALNSGRKDGQNTVDAAVEKVSDAGKHCFTVWIDPDKANYKLVRSLPAEICIKYGQNFTLLPKALKNETEIAHMRKTHVKDGAAVTKLIYWLKQTVKNGGAYLDDEKTGLISAKIRSTKAPAREIRELNVAEKMEVLRGEQEGYLGPSFETIAAYGENGAIVHYTASEKNNRKVEPRGFFLLDTGGFYLGGTTDITRTIALGRLTQQEKEHYTAVLKGNLALGAAVFPAGTRGIQLDAIARRPIWQIGYDYNHGTGHGVGFMLSVHEGPNSIRSRITGSIEESAVLREGMITSNEPGIYIEGYHGVRLETLILGRKWEDNQKSEEGKMLCFETLTLVPFDRDAILTERLNEEEKQLLNEYHRRVYREISPYLSEEERTWLRQETQPFV